MRIQKQNLYRTFITRHKGLVTLSLVLSAAAAGLEGLFVVLIKIAADALKVTGGAPSIGMPLVLVCAGLVAATGGRSILQSLQCRLEASAFVRWVSESRRELMDLISSHHAPLHRHPMPQRLARLLGEGGEGLAEALTASSRCASSAVHALAFLPLLAWLSWRLALLAALAALPAWALARWRVKLLARKASAWNRKREAAARSMRSMRDHIEERAGNPGFLQGMRTIDGELLERDKGLGEWEAIKASLPHSMEFALSILLAGLFLIASGSGLASGADAPSLLAFAVLLALLHRPLREWARHHPIAAAGERLWENWNQFKDEVRRAPIRIPAARIAGRAIVLTGVRFSYRSLGSGMPHSPAECAASKQSAGRDLFAQERDIHGLGYGDFDGMQPPGILHSVPADRPRLVQVFPHLDLRLDVNDVTMVAGPNGTGKSTLLRLLAHMEQPDAGRILYPEVLFRADTELSIAYLPQRCRPQVDIGEHLRRLRHHRPDSHALLVGRLDLHSVLERLEGISPDEALSTLEALSGGERQRLCLAHAFSSEEKLLLLDEPTSALPGRERLPLLEDLLKWWRMPIAKGGPSRGAVVVCHEVGFRALADQVIDLGHQDEILTREPIHLSRLRA